MQRIILDTNVIVSSLITKNTPHMVVNEVIYNSGILLCISQELLKEYYNVLDREKFSNFEDFKINAKNLLIDIESISKVFHPKTFHDILKDKDDNKLLDLAVESKADFIITGNTKDFIIDKFSTTNIVSPKKYWLKYKHK